MQLLFPALAGAVTALEMLLIFTGVLPPMFQNAGEALAFSLANLLLMAAAGWGARSPLRGAIAGATVGVSTMGVFVVSLIAALVLRIPLLGINVGWLELAVLISILVAVNLGLALLVGAIAGLASEKMKTRGKT